MIIKPAKRFAGDATSIEENKLNFSWLKPEVPAFKIQKLSKNSSMTVFFLPAYKADENGEGVWYKSVRVRTQFGTDFRYTYAVENEEEDPASYFYKNLKANYPELAKTKKSGDGKDSIYPACGYLGNRFLYNVIPADISAFPNGSYVWDAPKSMAREIDKYHNTLDFKKNPNPIICDPNGLVPVTLSLNGNQWSFLPDKSTTMRREDLDEYPGIYDRLVDPDVEGSFIRNLDEVIEYKPKEAILSELRKEPEYDREIIEVCLAGYEHCFGDTSSKKAVIENAKPPKKWGKPKAELEPAEEETRKVATPEAIDEEEEARQKVLKWMADEKDKKNG